MFSMCMRKFSLRLIIIYYNNFFQLIKSMHVKVTVNFKLFLGVTEFFFLNFFVRGQSLWRPLKKVAAVRKNK